MKIGQKILFDKIYSRKCKERFPNASNCQLQEIPFGIKLDKPIRGFVVGIRNVIMKNYRLHLGRNYYEEVYADPNWAEGDKEEVLLVTKNIREEPFLVRKEDYMLL